MQILKIPVCFCDGGEFKSGRQESCAGHLGYRYSIYTDVNADVNLSSKKVGECGLKLNSGLFLFTGILIPRLAVLVQGQN